MTLQRVAFATTMLNVVLFLALVSQLKPVAAQDVAPVLRGRSLEIVDAQGRVRASLGILPAERTSAGAALPETVILRLMNTRGRPAVKISASDQGSGLSLTGSAESQETYVSIGSSGASSQLKLRNEDGREQVLKP